MEHLCCHRYGDSEVFRRKFQVRIFRAHPVDVEHLQWDTPRYLHAMLPECREKPVVRVHGKCAPYLACLLPEACPICEHPALALEFHCFIIIKAGKHHCPVKFFKQLIIEVRFKTPVNIAFRIKNRKPIYTQIHYFFTRQFNSSQ
ncbi:Uncharacterised protein [uncultured archaeon]|nr:Uncharacterised protein [uncultured archaeon]